MSHLLYSHRLLWDGRSGVAALGGRYRKLHTAPTFRDDIDYVDYAPEVRVAQIRTGHGQMRDMTSAEIAQSEAYLQATFAAPAVPDAPATAAHASAAPPAA